VNDKQTVFVAEYLKDFNATQAAIRSGYSAKTAYSSGQRLLKDVEIDEAIKAGIAERSMGSDEVLLRLAEHGRADIGDFLDIESMGFQIDLAKAKELGKTHLIRKIKQKVTTIVTKLGDEIETIQTDIELVDQQAALALLGKYHNLFVDKQEVTGANGGPQQVEIIYTNTPYPITGLPSGTSGNPSKPE